MNVWRKGLLAARIWGLSLAVRVATRVFPLPAVVARLRRAPRPPRVRLNEPAHLGRIVRRVLTVAGSPPRCLVAALVTYRLLRAEGQSVDLVIGLPADPAEKDAHAWLELEGLDVGPPPGRAGHVELARYA